MREGILIHAKTYGRKEFLPWLWTLILIAPWFLVLKYYLVLEKSVTNWCTIYGAQQCVEEFRTDQIRQGEKEVKVFSMKEKVYQEAEWLRYLYSWNKIFEEFLQGIFISCWKDWVCISVRISASLIAIFVLFLSTPKKLTSCSSHLENLTLLQLV